jgi:O-antigen/teichoic acid export membrane protein
MTFIYYLLIGTIFTLILDLLANYLKSEKRFNNIERIVVIVLWPVSMVVFFRELLRAKNNRL